MSKYLLSLCIPTNGVVEWVLPVLDSIYNQNVDLSLFEVIVTDNGSNEVFENKMTAYREKFLNLKYIKTNAFEFLNEIESYKNAEGEFIKFLNHRTKLLPGTLDYLLKFVRNNMDSKPCVYFANGVLKRIKGVNVYNKFSDFIVALSYYSSWSTGMGFWRDDFLKIPADINYNTLFPHTTILFCEKNRDHYLLDNNILLEEIPVGKIPKGRYNLFYAFAVEYVSILLDLYRSDYIGIDDFTVLKKDNEDFLTDLYLDYIVRKKPCSYDLSNTKESINVFYNIRRIKRKSTKLFFKKALKKIFRT